MTVSGYSFDRRDMTPTRCFAVYKIARTHVCRLLRMEVKLWFNQRGRFHARRLSLIPLQLVYL